MSRKLQRPTETVVLAALACGGLYVAVAALGPQFTLGPVGPHLIVLHTLLELASIFVSFSVFIVNWEASKQSGNTQSLFLAVGFLSVAALDTMHTLSYPGMPDFITRNDADKAIYFWIAARLWAALLLWSSAYLGAESLRWYLRRSILLAGSFLVSGCVLLLVLLLPGWLPPMYVEGTGPTTLKLLLECLVIVINLLGIAGHMRAYRFTGEWSSIVLVGALVVAIFSELAFVQYGGGADLFIVQGHLYKVVAYYLIFRALLACAVRRPYQQLKLAKDRLERAVSELDARNRELDALDDVALTLSSTLKPRELLESAIEKTMRVLRARAGAVFLLEEGTHRLELAAHRGLTEDAVCQCLSHAPRLPYPYRVVPPAESFGQSTALDDLALVRSIGGAPARIAPLRTCMCAPVMSKGKTLGAIAMVGQEGRTFSPRDADLLTAIGYQLGLATENARLYERTDERLREKVGELQAAELRSRFLSEVGALL